MHRSKSKPFTKFILTIIVLAAIALAGWIAVQQPEVQQLSDQISRLVRKTTTPKDNPQGHDSSEAIVRFAALSDAHQDDQHFPKIVGEIAERDDLDFVAYLGDLSDAGDKAKLQQGKSVLDTIGPPVYVLPGDHDYNWFPDHDLRNFMQVFGLARTYFSFDRQGQHFLFIDNSDLNIGIEPNQWTWIERDLEQHTDQPIYVFMSTPISNPYLSFKAMGSQSDAVKQQSAELGQLLLEKKVKAIFTGDTHTFAQFKDESTGLPIITVGASGSTKNLLPLYVIVDIFPDGSYNVTSKPYQEAIPVQGSD